jgi:hypothetical protein
MKCQRLRSLSRSTMSLKVFVSFVQKLCHFSEPERGKNSVFRSRGKSVLCFNHYHHQPINVGHCWGTGLPYGLHIRWMVHNPPRGPSAGWWVLTNANTAGTNGLTCLPKHGGARGNKFLVSHLITDQCCLTSAIARRSALTAGLSGSSSGRISF